MQAPAPGRAGDEGEPFAPMALEIVRPGAGDPRMRRAAARLGLVEVPWAPERLAGVVPDPAVAALVADLGGEDPARREAASAALRDPRIPDEQVLLQLARPPSPLGNEAHVRLLDVARARIVDAPRGALGIQMAGRFGEADGVTVTGLIPNMPARKVLRAGDRIVELEGQRLADSARLSEIVQAHRPGDRLRAVVMRGERDELGRVRGGPDGRPVEARLEVELEVGSREDLERFGDRMMASPRYDAGREQLAAELLRAFPPPIRTVEAAWLPGERPDVDGHPYIVELKEWLRSAEAASAIDPASVLAQRLDHLRGMARAPGLSRPEREWFEAAARRYEELLAARAAQALPPGAP
jgi:hypothetical protein